MDLKHICSMHMSACFTVNPKWFAELVGWNLEVMELQFLRSYWMHQCLFRSSPLGQVNTGAVPYTFNKRNDDRLLVRMTQSHLGEKWSWPKEEKYLQEKVYCLNGEKYFLWRQTFTALSLQVIEMKVLFAWLTLLELNASICYFLCQWRPFLWVNICY